MTTDTPETAELKPCPFCGHTEIRVFRNTCVCRSCGAQSEDLGDLSFPLEKCLEMAIEKWNQRA